MIDDINIEEFPENQLKIKTEEELNKLSTEEGLSELDKGVY
jgi:hypothetical protein